MIAGGHAAFQMYFTGRTPSPDALDDLETWDYDENGETKPRSDSDSAARMLKYVYELETYITNNAPFIVNYGERYRNGERISTGFVESTVNAPTA